MYCTWSWHSEQLCSFNNSVDSRFWCRNFKNDRQKGSCCPPASIYGLKMQRVIFLWLALMYQGQLTDKNHLSYLQCDPGSYITLQPRNVIMIIKVSLIFNQKLNLLDQGIWFRYLGRSLTGLNQTQKEDASCGFITIYSSSLWHKNIKMQADLRGWWHIHWEMIVLWLIWKTTALFCNLSLNFPL